MIMRNHSHAVLEEVFNERARQIEEHGYCRDHDDAQTQGQLARAGASYALHAGQQGEARHRHDRANNPPPIWPTGWDVKHWRPGIERRELVKAMALLLAEVERIDRAGGGMALAPVKRRADYSRGHLDGGIDQ